MISELGEIWETSREGHLLKKTPIKPCFSFGCDVCRLHEEEKQSAMLGRASLRTRIMQAGWKNKDSGSLMTTFYTNEFSNEFSNIGCFLL